MKPTAIPVTGRFGVGHQQLDSALLRLSAPAARHRGCLAAKGFQLLEGGRSGPEIGLAAHVDQRKGDAVATAMHMAIAGDDRVLPCGADPVGGAVAQCRWTAGAMVRSAGFFKEAAEKASCPQENGPAALSGCTARRNASDP